MISRIVARFVLAFLVAGPAQAGSLCLTVAGVRSDSGALLIGFYDRADGFRSSIANAARSGLLSDKARLVGVTMRARLGAQGICVLHLPPGRYAVIVFHDENDNGILDENFLGIPTEGYGFSNNATGFFSAPAFGAAAVAVGAAEEDVTIDLSYPARSFSPRPVR